MHIAIVGAGALGSAYGARLSQAGAEITLVVRAGKEACLPIRLERVETSEAFDWTTPRRAVAIPETADVVLVCVRNEQLSDELFAQLAASKGPLVVMTPMLPEDYARVSHALAGRAVAAMPGIVAYVSQANPDGVVIRHWLPRVASTLIDESQPAVPAIQALAEALQTAKIATKIEPDVHTLNPATTIAFAPITMALDAAGFIDALLADTHLLGLALRANDEAQELARTVGKVAGWAHFLKFAGSMTLRMGIGLARSRAPEAVMFVEQHFGRKLRAQNIAMGEQMVRLAGERSVEHEALSALLDRLKAHASIRPS